jgi:hypothetical protein
MGVVGAVAEFTPAQGEDVAITWDGPALTARTPGGALRLMFEDRVRALAFAQAEGPEVLVLAVLREGGRPPRAHGLTLPGPDHEAIEAPDRRALLLYDLGLGRKEARFCLRLPPGALADRISAAPGAGLAHLLPAHGAALLAANPVRVVETALGRAEIAWPKGSATGTVPRVAVTTFAPGASAASRAGNAAACMGVTRSVFDSTSTSAMATWLTLSRPRSSVAGPFTASQTVTTPSIRRTAPKRVSR